MNQDIQWSGITITVTHTENWLTTGYDHVELRADCRLPVTETGYRSHFLPATELAIFESVEDFVVQWLDGAATSKVWQQYLRDSQQLTLF
jgi:hypothetical protein